LLGYKSTKVKAPRPRARITLVEKTASLPQGTGYTMDPLAFGPLRIEI
jgi:hypothetical protein